MPLIPPLTTHLFTSQHLSYSIVAKVLHSPTYLLACHQAESQTPLLTRSLL